MKARVAEECRAVCNNILSPFFDENKKSFFGKVFIFLNAF